MIDAILTHTLKPGHGRTSVVSPKEILAHFELCPMCGQAVDRRDIFAVRHHLPVGHARQPVH